MMHEEERIAPEEALADENLSFDRETDTIIGPCPIQEREFIETLRDAAAIDGKELKIRINDNRSTMLSVRWDSNHTRVSLHRMFLSAPDTVMTSLVTYIKGKKRDLSTEVKAYIDENLRTLDYSHRLDSDYLVTKGEAYDLEALYTQINEEYFSEKLELNITWYGRRSHRNRSRLTFGLYDETLKLIKINRLLDTPAVPEWVLEYVIFHEMAHHVCPSYVDESGRHQIHNEEFRRLERSHRHYVAATQWILEHRERMFSGEL